MTTTTKTAGMMMSFLMIASLVACSGSTSGVTTGDGGTDGGGGGDGGEGPVDPMGCSTSDIALQRACVPGTAKANVPLRIRVDADGCFGCGQTVEPCTVQVTGPTITVGLTAKKCPVTGPCAAVCGLPSADCTIPALAAGTYNIQFASGVHSSEEVGRQLVVSNTGTATSCDLPQDNHQPPQISAADFPQSCVVADDCAPVISGDVCSLCACPTAAIAKTSLDSYQSALREKRALCKAEGGAASCAPCATPAVACGAGKCTVAPPLP